MYLLNKETIITENRKKEFGIVEIKPLKADNLLPTYYYFRLGGDITRWDSDTGEKIKEDISQPGNHILKINPGEFILVRSRERFRCSKQVLAIFGNRSSLLKEGLTIRNSPFIDPNFPHLTELGYLDIALKNELPIPLKLQYEDKIGKISFFNVSDTYPVSDVEGTDSEEDYRSKIH